ncbi:MAG: hypothetical protein HEEMFOPI_01991 [Holosporales bacterium]
MQHILDTTNIFTQIGPGLLLLLCIFLISALSEKKIQKITVSTLISKVLLLAMAQIYIKGFLGFDGYYDRAVLLSNSGLKWSLLNEPALYVNYKGIIVFYASFFYIFGKSILIPIIINSTLGICAAILFLNNTKENKINPVHVIWLLAFFPSFLFYDLSISKESVVIYFFMIAVTIFHSIKNWRHVFLFTITSFVLGIIRPPMLIVLIISLFAHVVLFKKNFFAFGIAVLLLISFPSILEITNLAGWKNYSTGFEAQRKMQEISPAYYNWSENSLGKKLLPNSKTQEVLFSIPRGVLYFFSPFKEVFQFNQSQNLISKLEIVGNALAAFVDLLILPFLISFFIRSKEKHYRLLYFYLFTWLTTWAAIAGGNIMIHVRYRTLHEFLYIILTILILSKSKHQLFEKNKIIIKTL